MQTNNVAFLIKGAISSGSKPTKHIQEKTIISCYKTIYKHIVGINKSYNFDFYIHSWNYQFEDLFTSLYNPTLSVFEDNKIYEKIISERSGDTLKESYPSIRMKHSRYNQCSHCLSIQKVTNLLKNNLEKNYKYVFYYRPDVILNKNVILTDYQVDKFVYSNDFNGGDFHWAMNVENSLKFGDIFEKNTFGWGCHGFIDKFIQEYLGIPIERDKIKPGPSGDQEVFYKSSNNFKKYAFNINVL